MRRAGPVTTTRAAADSPRRCARKLWSSASPRSEPHQRPTAGEREPASASRAGPRAGDRPRRPRRVPRGRFPAAVGEPSARRRSRGRLRRRAGRASSFRRRGETASRRLTGSPARGAARYGRGRSRGRRRGPRPTGRGRSTLASRRSSAPSPARSRGARRAARCVAIPRLTFEPAAGAPGVDRRARRRAARHDHLLPVGERRREIDRREVCAVRRAACRVRARRRPARRPRPERAPAGERRRRRGRRAVPERRRPRLGREPRQRLGLGRPLVRADPGDPRPATVRSARSGTRSSASCVRVRLITHPGSPTNRHASVPLFVPSVCRFREERPCKDRGRAGARARSMRSAPSGTNGCSSLGDRLAGAQEDAEHGVEVLDSRPRLTLATGELPRPAPATRRLASVTTSHTASAAARRSNRSSAASIASGARSIRPTSSAAAGGGCCRPTPSGRERATRATVRATRLPSWFASSFGACGQQLLAEVDVAGARDVAHAPPAQRVGAVPVDDELERIERSRRSTSRAGARRLSRSRGRRRPSAAAPRPRAGSRASRRRGSGRSPCRSRARARRLSSPPGRDSVAVGAVPERREVVAERVEPDVDRPEPDRRAPGSPSRARARAAARR